MDQDMSLFASSDDFNGGKNGNKRGRGSGASSSSATQAASTGSGANRKKRKKEKVQDLEERVKALEDQNAELRLQLKVGIETQKRDEQEKKEMTKELEDLIKSNASEGAFSKLLMTYVKRFSDYGEDRTRIIQKHMKQLKNLLVPTQVTKMCIWTLHQDDDFYQPEQDADGTSQEKLWTILTKHIEATEEQKEGIKMHREHAIKMAKDLRFTIRACEELESRMKRKNEALAEEMKELRKILSPVQMAKFIVWVNEHKASMAMLDKLWSPKDELRRNSSSKIGDKRSDIYK